MHAQPALSHELIDLFDQVHHQADEYVELFNLIRRKTRELDDLRTEMLRSLKDFRGSSTEELVSARQRSDSALDDLQRRINFVHEVHKELEDIKRLKLSLTELKQGFQKKTIELDTVVQSVKQFVKSEVETTFVTQDKNIDRRLKAVLTELSSFDGRLVSIQDLHRREFMQISDEVAKIKGRIADTKALLETATQSIDEVIEEKASAMEEKNKEFVSDLNIHVKSVVEGMMADGVLHDRLNGLRLEIHTVERQLRTMKGKGSQQNLPGIILGGVALLVAIASIFLH